MTYWHCLCECGRECDKTPEQLRNNSQVSCGICSPKKIKNNFKDLSGKRFGRLTVLSIDLDKRQEQFENNKNKKKKSYRTYWKCICDCGNETTVRTDHLEKGTIVSCGCFQKDVSKTVVPQKNWKTNEIIEQTDCIMIKSSNSDEYFKIDKEDYEKVKDYCWHSANGYAVAPIRGKKNKTIRMQRLIMNCGDKEDNLVVDHINHDTRDNRKVNLRIATDSENAWNSVKSHGSGIKYNSSLQKWNVYIYYNLQLVNLGLFNTEEEAKDIRDKAEKVFYGEFQYKDDITEEFR